ncbi:glycosyl hydrolase family 28-related protein [Pseudomonas aeruginosa]|uniref:glycosyl hydrolase family 28-related protein n=1 Tax=Pseudomonas aeruginosa TaxID=287 RepID=UPI000935735D|nr:glycosyl hydrolase family 28-related protein [Pseudomonas aeruginosa]
MPVRYNTMNPVEPNGSSDFRDLSDNTANLDLAMNGQALTWTNRIGGEEKSWRGIVQWIADWLAAQGFEPGVLEYVDGSPLTVDRPTQLIQRDGNLYSVKRPASFPVELTGNWATDQDLLVTQVDRSLRQQLADPLDPTAGGALVARASRHLSDLTGLIGLSGRYAGDMVQTAAYWGGWSVYADGPVGGGTYVWDPARPRSEHNAGNVISPTVPWDGLESSFAAYIAATGETEPSALGCWVLVPEHGREFNVLQWGAKNNATVNGANDAMIQPLLNYVEGAKSGGFGGVVNFPKGTYRFNTYFNVRDRTAIRGEGTHATIIQFPGSAVGNCITLGPTGPNHPINPNGHWVFGARLENLAISCSNVYKGSERSVVYTDGAHEHSGLFNVVVRDFTSWGVNYNTGNGGPALFEVSDCEFYLSGNAPATGTKRGIVSNAGGALFLMRHVTITGAPANKLDQGVLMLKDNLVAQGLHFENSGSGISLSQNDPANPRVNSIVGVTGNATVSSGGLVDISSSFEGSVQVSAVVNKSISTTGLITLINRRVNDRYLDSPVSSYSYPSAYSPGEAISQGRVNVSGAVATVAKSVGVSFTASRTGVGVVRITLSSAMNDTDYTVTPSARPSGGGAMFVEFLPVSATAFDIKTYNQAGTATDPASIWFTLLR